MIILNTWGWTLRPFTPNQMWCQGDLISLCPTFLDGVVKRGVPLAIAIMASGTPQPPSRQTYLIKILATFLSYSQDFQNTWLLTLTKVSMESIECLSQVIVFINLDVNITRRPGRVTTIPISLLQLKGKNDYTGHISYVFINEFTLKGVFCYVTVINEGKRTDLTTWPKSGPKTFQMDCMCIDVL